MNLFSESSFDSFDEDFRKKKEHHTSWLCILLTTGKFLNFIAPKKGGKAFRILSLSDPKLEKTR